MLLLLASRCNYLLNLFPSLYPIYPPVHFFINPSFHASGHLITSTASQKYSKVHKIHRRGAGKFPGTWVLAKRPWNRWQNLGDWQVAAYLSRIFPLAFIPLFLNLYSLLLIPLQILIPFPFSSFIREVYYWMGDCEIKTIDAIEYDVEETGYEVNRIDMNV